MPEVLVDQTVERQAPARTEHPLEIDYQELATYAHNARCYYWEHWLGLRPPNTFKEAYECFLRDELHGWYNQTPTRDCPNWDGVDEWRTVNRLKRAIASYVASPPHWDRLRGRKVWSKPLGSTLSYSGRLDAAVLVQGVLWFVVHKFSEHRTDSDQFLGRFVGSPEMIGNHWLGEYAWRLMLEAKLIERDVKYGGIILDGIQLSKTIDRRVTTFLTPSTYQIEQFLRNAFVIGEEIIRRRSLTRTHLAMGEPARNAWPNWGDDHFCPWKALNKAASLSDEEDFLDTCTHDPWWERREG